MSSTLVMSDSIVFITISTLWCWCVQWCDIQADPNISKLGVGYRPLCLLGFLGYVFFQIIIIFTYLSIISSSMTTKDGQRSDLRWPMRCATLSGVFLYFISGLTTFFCNNRHHQRLAQGFTSTRWQKKDSGRAGLETHLELSPTRYVFFSSIFFYFTNAYNVYCTISISTTTCPTSTTTTLATHTCTLHTHTTISHYASIMVQPHGAMPVMAAAVAGPRGMHLDLFFFFLSF